MKKIFLISALLVVFAAVAIGISMKAPTANASAVPTVTSSDPGAEPKYEPALRIEFSDTSAPLPEGYYRASIRNKTDEKGQMIWMRAFGNLDGYSLEKANKLTFVAKNGTVPCGCHMSGACYVYKGAKADPVCDDGCSPGLCGNDITGASCKPGDPKAESAKNGEVKAE